MDYPHFRILVVDNGSTDGSPEYIEAHFPEVISLRNQQNAGFAAGNNAGIEAALRAGADYVLLLNNDAVVETSLLKELVDIGEKRPEAGLLGPKINYYDNREVIWSAGGRTHWLTLSVIDKGFNEPDRGQRDSIKEVDHVSGCAMLIKRRVAEDIGLLDANFFMYYEDCDYCERAKKSGYKLLYVPEGKVWHKVSLSTKGNVSAWRYFRAKSRIRFFKKHRSGIMLVPIVVFSVLSAVWTIAKDVAHGEIKAVGALIKGSIEGIIQPV